MKTKNKVNRKRKPVFNVPVQFMVTEKIEEQLNERTIELSKSRADYLRGLILNDLSNKLNNNQN